MKRDEHEEPLSRYTVISLTPSFHHNLTMTTENTPEPSKWATFMMDIYRSQKPPQPLGTVSFDEIEARARRTLMYYPGEAPYITDGANINIP